jgi:AraC-like DNA-binding protein
LACSKVAPKILPKKSVDDARLLLSEALRKKQALPTPGMKNDWPDLLAAELTRNSSIELGAWAKGIGLARETVSRGFTAAYNVTPALFRAELRARAAWLQVTQGSACLCSIAAETGFADQAHMTRWILRLTGTTPAAWRRNLSG